MSELRREIDAEAEKLCDAVNYWDDRLGKYADYEGGQVGPTFHLWKSGVDDFEIHCLGAIEAHRQAIKVLTQFRRLNGKRAALKERNRG